MISNLLLDLRLYRRLIAMQLRAQLQYKMNVFIDIATYLSVTGLEFVPILIYFGSFPSLLGWKVGEVALLFAITSITEGLLIFVLALSLLPGFNWTPLKLLVLPLGIVSGALVFIAILLLGATLCFWTVETTEITNILTYGGRELLSYPLTIYNQGLQRFFLFLVPLAFGTYIPTCYLLGRSLPFGLPGALAFGAPLVALAFALIAGATWRFGVPGASVCIVTRVRAASI